MQRGVFYTPQPVVSYIVRSVHELLQTEFGLDDGLADTTTWGEMLKKHPGLKLPPLTDEPGEKRTISPDEPFVQILDPPPAPPPSWSKSSTSSTARSTAKWKQQRLTDAQQIDRVERLCAEAPAAAPARLRADDGPLRHRPHEDRPQARRDRLPLRHRGARPHLPHQRPRTVGEDSCRFIGFDALAHEAAAVNEIKRHKRFTVVIGNPPYSGISSNMTEYAQRIVDAYKIRGRCSAERTEALACKTTT